MLCELFGIGDPGPLPISTPDGLKRSLVASLLSASGDKNDGRSIGIFIVN